MAGWARGHPHLCAAGVLAIVLLIWFLPLLWGEQMGQSNVLWRSWPWLGDRPAGLELQPRSTDADIAYLFHPLLDVVVAQVRGGEVPLWNPYSYGGTALLGDLETAVLFPLTWPAFLLGASAAWGWITLLKLLVAGLGAYALARRLRVPWFGALLAGGGFMLSAPMMGWAQWSLASVAALFPWLLVATDRLRERPDGRRVAQLALVVGLMILAGHPETAWMAGAAGATFLVACMVLVRRGAGASDGPAAWRIAAGWLGAHVLGVGVSAAALVPFLQAYAVSVTRAEHAGYFANSRLPRASAVTYLLPGIFGDARRYYETSSDWNQTAAYVGVAALAFALVAAVRARRDPRAQALVLVAVLALMAAFSLPPVSWVFGSLPPFDQIITFKVLWIPALALAVGAGAGVASLVRRPLPVRRGAALVGGIVVAAGALVAFAAASGKLAAPASVERDAALRFAAAVLAAGALLAVLGRVDRRWALAAVVVVLVADLAYLRDVNVLLPARYAHPGATPALRALQRQPRPARMSSEYAFFFRPAVLPPNTSALFRLESATGYDFPLSRRWADLSTKVWGQTGNTPEHSYTSLATSGGSLAALRAMAVGLHLTAPGRPPPGRGFLPLYRGPDGIVWRDPGALPRAYVVPRVRTADREATIASMRRGAWDPRREALVPSGTAPIAPGAGARLRPAAYRQVDSQHVRVRVPPGPGGWLVIADAYAPEWQATVDGKPAELKPTNLAAMGLPLTAGRHTVKISYSHTGFDVGLAITIASLGLCTLLGFRPRRRVAPA